MEMMLMMMKIILLTRNKNKLLPVRPLGLYANFTFFWHEAGFMDKTLTDS